MDSIPLNRIVRLNELTKSIYESLTNPGPLKMYIYVILR